jgi:NAD(P)-dependent dehydrogenase (short-subunit alcohol dehydrogenase family)
MAKKICDSGFKDWSPEQLPDLNGKTYLVTGGNAGIGFEAVKMLAGAGARVMIGARNQEKGVNAAAEASKAAGGPIDVVKMDLADLSSVRAAAGHVRKRTEKIDGLVNNAGIMMAPQGKTADGFELQFGTNHLGHFLLTGLLFDLVERAAGRIVVIASAVHRFGKFDFDDLMVAKNYTPGRAYSQSKLANLMFALELHRRLQRAKSTATAYACHPGFAATQTPAANAGAALKAVHFLSHRFLAQPAQKGAIPTVLCAAGKEAVPGGYYGPQGMGGMRGRVSDAVVSDYARNEEIAARLWDESEKLVNFHWDAPQKAA